jgi:hypothetical protein
MTTTVSTTGDRSAAARAFTMAAGVLELQWHDEFSYCSPNLARYRWQWLWDSCFNAIIWSSLGDERAVAELEAVFFHQSADGFVPHMGYQAEPEVATGLWGRPGSSTITQPPMFGHALVEVAAEGFDVEHLVAPALRGLRFFAEHRRGPHGLIRIVHPWESGADNTPRWDAWCPGGFERERWLQEKLRLISRVVSNEVGSSVANPDFDVYPASFNALVAFNALELGRTFNDEATLRFGHELTEAIEQLWRPELGTWVDVDEDGAALGSNLVIDALLPVLLDPTKEQLGAVTEQLWSPSLLGAPFGPCSVSRSEPAFDPQGYWRGPGWPHLTYLHWVALERSGHHAEAGQLADQLLTACVTSSFGEYVEPFTGEPLGAQPQTWGGLSIVPVRHELRRLHGPASPSPTSITRAAPR